MTIALETEKPDEQLTVPADVLPPTPDEIDETIADYDILVTVARTAQKDVDDAKERLVFLVDHFGTVPPHAEQSRRLVGRHHEVTVTRGTTVSINDDGVVELNNFLSSKGLLSLFPRFFKMHTKFSLVDGARDVLKTVKLPRRVEEKIASLFGRSIDVKSKSPAVKTNLLDAEKPERMPRKGKAAA